MPKQSDHLHPDQTRGLAGLSRQLTPADRLLGGLGATLRTLWGGTVAQRPCPTAPGSGTGPRSDHGEPGPLPPRALSPEERELAGSLMRVNHVGEVCAQALYQAQGLTARSPALRAQMREAAREEADHLAWTETRLQQLGARTSLLNPLWFAGAFGIGLLAGRLGDAASLGFVVETERQVEAHLASHLERLPPQDAASRAIVEQMRQDEVRHGQDALNAGAREVPAPVQGLMRAAARVMTFTAHHV